MSGFFLPLWLVAVLIALHKIHLVIFGDCILTALKRVIGAIGTDENFIQYAVRRIFARTINKKVSGNINYMIYAATISASLLRYFMVY